MIFTAAAALALFSSVISTLQLDFQNGALSRGLPYEVKKTILRIFDITDDQIEIISQLIDQREQRWPTDGFGPISEERAEELVKYVRIPKYQRTIFVPGCVAQSHRLAGAIFLPEDGQVHYEGPVFNWRFERLLADRKGPTPLGRSIIGYGLRRRLGQDEQPDVLGAYLKEATTEEFDRIFDMIKAEDLTPEMLKSFITDELTPGRVRQMLVNKGFFDEELTNGGLFVRIAALRLVLMDLTPPDHVEPDAFLTSFYPESPRIRDILKGAVGMNVNEVCAKFMSIAKGQTTRLFWGTFAATITHWDDLSSARPDYAIEVVHVNIKGSPSKAQQEAAEYILKEAAPMYLDPIESQDLLKVVLHPWGPTSRFSHLPPHYRYPIVGPLEDRYTNWLVGLGLNQYDLEAFLPTRCGIWAYVVDSLANAWEVAETVVSNSRWGGFAARFVMISGADAPGEWRYLSDIIAEVAQSIAARVRIHDDMTPIEAKVFSYGLAYCLAELRPIGLAPFFDGVTMDESTTWDEIFSRLRGRYRNHSQTEDISGILLSGIRRAQIKMFFFPLELQRMLDPFSAM